MFTQLLMPSIHLIFATGFIALWMTNKHIKAAGMWGIGYFVSAIGFALEIPLSANDQLEYIRPIIDACYLAGGLFCAIGLSIRFTGSYPKLMFIGSYIGLVIMSNWAWIVFDNYSVRSEIISYGSAMLMLAGAFYAYPKMKPPIEKMLFYAIVAFATQFALTCFVSVHLLNEVIDENSSQNSSYIQILAFSVAVTSIIMVLLQFLHLGMEMIKRLLYESHTDPLTQLNNRRAFETTAQELIKSQDGVSLIICDIDHFKKVNDRWGHQLGDDILKCFAAILKEVCPRQSLFRQVGRRRICHIADQH